MNFKKVLFISLFVLFLSVSVVSAADLNNTHVSESSVVISDYLVSGAVDTSSSSVSTGNFNDLQKEINNAPAGSVLNLTRDYNGAENVRVNLNKDLTIDGQGHTINCLKKDDCSAFYSSSGNIVLKNLNIINGYNDDNHQGGAIHIEGSAQYTLENCTFYHNWADDYGGAIYNGVEKPLTIINCQFNNNEADDDNGGAIYSKGVLNIENSRFFGNLANVDGGAVYTEGNIDVKNSRFDVNKVVGANSQCYGGAICAKGNVLIDNCIFVGNSAEDYGGAVYAKNVYINKNEGFGNFSSLFIGNIAADNKGGAIYADGCVNAVNTVFKLNRAKVDGGAVYTKDNVDVKHCLFESNRVNGTRYSQCYGGAIRSEDDAIIDNCTFNNNYAEDYGGAVYAKNVYINKNEGFGNFSSLFIGNIAGDDKGGAVYADGRVNAVNAIFKLNSANVDGGAVYAKDNVDVKRCFFEYNKADGDNGGAILAKGDAIIDNCTFNNNYAEDYGGAVYADNIYINNAQSGSEPFNTFFIGNNAGNNDGGALYSYCDTHVKNAVFTGNSAYEDGGAIFCCDNAYVTHCLFESNNAIGASFAQCEGGAIHCKDDLTVDNCTFNKNYAHDYGGAIYADTLELKGYSYFNSNTAQDNHGGAIYVNKFREDVTHVSFTNNWAGDDGGAIYINSKNWITFSECEFVNNHCGDEGGVIYLDSIISRLSLRYNIFRGNDAGKEGQAVFTCGSYDEIKNNFWRGNNPSSSNDMLVEWKCLPWESNVYHTDSNPKQ